MSLTMNIPIEADMSLKKEKQAKLVWNILQIVAEKINAISVY